MKEMKESSNLVSKEEHRLLIESLDKPVLVDLLYKLGLKDPSIAEEIKTIANVDQTRRKLFVRDLSLNTTSQSLCDAFKEYGEIEEGKVIFDKHTQKSCRYGYIIYKHMKSAQNALSTCGKLIDGRLTLCMLAQEKAFYSKLITTSNEWNAARLFCGACGYGFVTYKTVEAANNATKYLDQTTIEGKNMMVRYAARVPPQYIEGYPYPQTDAPYAKYYYPYAPYYYPQYSYYPNPY